LKVSAAAAFDLQSRIYCHISQPTGQRSKLLPHPQFKKEQRMQEIYKTFYLIY